ncbi:MAG: immunity 26/phosphotriesterase HocA family protein [Candidatus Limnocylindria bacterium]
MTGVSGSKQVRGAVEGDAYAVPLPGGGYATVVVARVAPKSGVTLGYFFGPRAPTVPDVGSLEGLRPHMATLTSKFGDLGIVQGTWPRIGRVPDWDRRQWPMPLFKRREPIGGRLWRVEYDADNPNSTPRESPIGEAEAAALPEDGLHGDVAVVRVLDLRMENVAR